MERLYVHLPGLKLVLVHEDSDLHNVINDDKSQKSTLTECFVTNKKTSFGHFFFALKSAGELHFVELRRREVSKRPKSYNIQLTVANTTHT
jgi:hypothetical protein